ncbi:hypothetical protein LA080_016336 [Diaporthe eres]|uniref:WD40 domain-containing protein n=1 Tax=Diaporthe vaccinii TaxID=105482 RepID=A0ABR4EK40_9PEZI|nr:hypothetical protein LA080_016336 [Diaporthe eres]
MRFSDSFQASPHCAPSPNGKFVATLSASSLHVRTVESLHTVRDIELPRDLSGPVTSLQWSPSSKLLLVAAAHQIHVFSVVEDDFHATIRNPLPPAAKPVLVGFGASDYQICLCASLGLRFAIFDLRSSKAVEVANPKFHATPSACCRGFCFRPRTGHLSILTRLSGKDMISIHDPTTIQAQRSWFPDTVDAQGLIWDPDGHWLLTWEAPAHGHKVLFYSSDGNLLKTWSGPQPLVAADSDLRLGPGVKLLEFSADARRLAIGDSSRRICILDMASVTESLRLQHPNSIAPTDTLQVWQEQVSLAGHHFVRAPQTISPPAGQSGNSGCALAVFDPSSTLLATKLEESPGTVWVWDIEAAELRAVLLFHASVSRLSWHPVIRETLLVSCEGDSHNSLAFTWDPLSEGPRPIDFAGQLLTGKVQVVWLQIDGLEPGALFASDCSQYMLASLANDDDEPLPWIAGDQQSGLLNGNSPRVTTANIDNSSEGEISELDDTFCFKRT